MISKVSNPVILIYFRFNKISEDSNVNIINEGYFIVNEKKQTKPEF